MYDDGNLKSKPDPDAYDKALAKLALSAEQCVVFEDALSGVESTYQAGIKRIIQLNSIPRLDNTVIWGRDFTDLDVAEINSLFTD